jgi:hypothetical protein
VIGDASETGRTGAAVSFDIPLASAPEAHFVQPGENPTSSCPGSRGEPLAAPGNLCIYATIENNVEFASYEGPLTEETGGGVTPFGFEVVGFSAKKGNYDESGTWAVTAP